MKSILAILLLNITFGHCLMFGQGQLPVEQKIHYSEKNKLFLNKDLGVYLWISTSPDENSEKTRLFSDSSKKYTNPLYFDTEGYNTVRSPSAVDTVSKRMAWPKRDIIFEVYSDSRCPYTKVKTEGKLLGMKNGQKVYLDKVKVTLNARDAMSGVENTYYSTNGAAFSVYEKPFSLQSVGAYELKYYSTDNVGNIEESRTISFTIETEATNITQ